MRSLEIREKVFGKEHPDVANSLNNLAGIYHEQGKYEEAEPLLRRSLSIYKKAFGEESFEVAFGLNNLAVLICMQNKTAEAETLCMQSLKILNKIPENDYPDGAAIRENCQIIFMKNRFEDAKKKI